MGSLGTKPSKVRDVEGATENKEIPIWQSLIRPSYVFKCGPSIGSPFASYWALGSKSSLSAT